MIIIITFFQVFRVSGQRGPSKVCSVGTRWMRNLIPHTTSHPAQNLTKNIGIYVENTNKKIVIFFLTPKLINIILLFSLGGPF